MEALKQFMGFLLLGTVIFLLSVFGALLDTNSILLMLAILLFLSVGAWIYGRGMVPTKSATSRGISFTAAMLILLTGLGLTTELVRSAPDNAPTKAAMAADGWQDWSPAAVDAALAQDKPVFVDFTAAWCLSCKVNERVALQTDAVKSAFTQKGVVLFRADWTHADPVISQALQQFHRDGVPLYLLYSPKAKDAPQVLPEVLTPGIVLDALGKL
jgi:thiol:disulfide interchange protein DsbD